MKVDELEEAVAAGSLDTVLVCFVDMQGRLVGKRFHARFFIDSGYAETHGCDYLLANDITMEPVPGYKSASWAKGYGDLCVVIWFGVGVLYFALVGRHRLVLSPEEEFAMQHRSEN